MVKTHQHDPACSGCPLCDCALAELLRMTDRKASEYLKSRDRARTVRAGSKFVTVTNREESTMSRVTKAGRVYIVPKLRAAAAPARRAPTIAERIVRAATHGATEAIGATEAGLIAAQIRHAEGSCPYGLPANDPAERLRAASANMRTVPMLHGVPDPWRLDEVRS